MSASIDKTLGHHQGGKDGKLCHETSSDTTPQLPCRYDDCSYLYCANHHCMSQLSIVESSFTLKHYKKHDWRRTRGWGHCELFLSFFLSFSLSLSLSRLTWALKGMPGQPIRAFLCREARSLDSSIWKETSLATTKGGIHPQLIRYRHWRCLWERTKMSTLSKSRSSTMGDESYFD